MLFDLSKSWIAIDCPNCGYSLDIQVRDVKLEETVICNNCKTNIHLQDADASAHNSVRDINKGMSDLDDLLKSF